MRVCVLQSTLQSDFWGQGLHVGSSECDHGVGGGLTAIVLWWGGSEV